MSGREPGHPDRRVTPSPVWGPNHVNTDLTFSAVTPAGNRLARAKHAYTTHLVDTTAACYLDDSAVPEIGDLVLARIATIGQHTKIERTDGRRATLFRGDEIVVAYGNRYAPDQFHALVPPDLGRCHLVAAGGIAARVEASHSRMNPATAIDPVGLLLRADGRRLNLRDVAAAPMVATTAERPITIVVVGTSMNSGKTTTAAHLVHGLRRAGARVGAAKVTGTGAGPDVWFLADAGADPVYDFTWAGLPSTYGASPAVVRDVFLDLTGRLAGAGCEVVVVEVADGIYQPETAALLADPAFVAHVDGLLVAAADSLGASAAASWLREHVMTPHALSGVLTSSPLASTEAASVTGHQVWKLERLRNPNAAAQFLADLRAQRALVALEGRAGLVQVA